ncbi:hypothetical protein [Microbacterium pumilum]|uniref:FHA domain-containing protein n=1 Tax=Microbacterium pumilum TaxID=344165 RepID=A0ABP5DGR0_9MICO
MTDIKLDNTETVIAVAPVFKVEGHDIILDAAERRRSDGASFRRALVHDQNDGLTVNFNNDYPGGVTINGVTSLTVAGDIEFRISHQDEVLLEGGHPPDEVVNFAEVIKTLRNEIRQLQSQLAE